MKAFHDPGQRGKVRHVGTGSIHCWQFAYLNEVASKNGTEFISTQTSTRCFTANRWGLHSRIVPISRRNAKCWLTTSMRSAGGVARVDTESAQMNSARGIVFERLRPSSTAWRGSQTKRCQDGADRIGLRWWMSGHEPRREGHDWYRTPEEMACLEELYVSYPCVHHIVTNRDLPKPTPGHA